MPSCCANQTAALRSKTAACRCSQGRKLLKASARHRKALHRGFVAESCPRNALLCAPDHSSAQGLLHVRCVRPRRQHMPQLPLVRVSARSDDSAQRGSWQREKGLGVSDSACSTPVGMYHDAFETMSQASFDDDDKAARRLPDYANSHAARVRATVPWPCPRPVFLSVAWWRLNARLPIALKITAHPSDISLCTAAGLSLPRFVLSQFIGFEFKRFLCLCKCAES